MFLQLRMLFFKLQRSPGVLKCYYSVNIYLLPFISTFQASLSLSVYKSGVENRCNLFFESKYLIRNRGEILFVALLAALEINLPVSHSFPLFNSWMKYLNRNRYEILHQHLWSQDYYSCVLNDPLTCPLASAAGSHLWFRVKKKKISSSIGWVSMEFVSDIQSPL